MSAQTARRHRMPSSPQSDIRPLPERDELALLRSALDASQTGIVIIDMLSPGRPIVFANDAIARRAGFSIDELVGRPSSSLTCREGNEESGPLIREAMMAGRELDVEVRSARKDGSVYWSQLNLTPIFDRSGTLTRYISVSSDISTRKEEEL